MLSVVVLQQCLILYRSSSEMHSILFPFISELKAHAHAEYKAYNMTVFAAYTLYIIQLKGLVSCL